MKLRNSLLVVLSLILLVLLFSRFGGKEEPAEVTAGETPVASADVTGQALTSTEGEVTVRVVPQRLDDQAWKFTVSLDTHSKELTADLTVVTELRDETGNVYRPLSWLGDGPGGHHREGVLQFKPIVPAPRSLVMTIRGVGDITERVFNWQLTK